jgi:carbamoyltransferase
VKKIFVGMRVFGHDSSIFSIDLNKRVVFALDTERVTRIKHDSISSFPALKFFFALFGIDEYSELSISVPMKEYKKSNYFRENRDIRWNYFRKAYDIKYAKDEIEANKKDRKVKYKNYFQKYTDYEKFIQNRKLSIPRYIEDYINHEVSRVKDIKIDTKFFDHHLCHNISSFAFSKYKEAICISFDGIGDNYSFKAYSMKKREKIEFLQIAESSFTYKICDLESNYGIKFSYYNSIASLYNFFTDIIGFLPNCEEGKVEALASFGSVKDDLLNKILDSFTISKDNGIKLVCYKEKILELILQKQDLKKYKKQDLAATIQKALESVILDVIEQVILENDCKNLCFSGGVFANVTLNRKIFEKFDKKIYIFPAMGDNGSSAGSVILDLMQEYNWDKLEWIENETMPFWGPKYTLKEILKEIEQYSDFIEFEYIEDCAEDISKEILNNNIIALFQDRMEFGPRALGNRSILASAFSLDTIEYINNKVKKREKFQPFCPVVLEEDAEKLFKKYYKNFHMTTSFFVKDEIAKRVPAMIHIDKTARVQFVTKDTNRLLYDILKNIKTDTGLGVVINTSFNLHGRTMVMSPKDAIVDFVSSGIDFLYFKNIKVKKRFS